MDETARAVISKECRGLKGVNLVQREARMLKKRAKSDI